MLCTKTYAATAVACGGTSGNYLVSFGYDLAGHPLSVSDNAASITAATGSASYAETMSYGSLNLLRNASWSPAPAQTAPTATAVIFSYQYDQTNRRINQTATDKSWWNYPTTAATISYTANNLNQYTAVGSASPTYDANGNLTNDGTYSYCYDVESRLTKILSAGTCASPTTVVASYAYDAQGRRKSKTVGSATTIYVTDADNREVLEYTGSSGAVSGWYTYATGPNDVLNRMDVAGTSRQTLIPDIQGSIVGILDASTGALSKTGYQPFGENPSLSSGSFQYSAARFDPEGRFYYMRSRMYRTDWGRFAQPDGIGYAGGNNLYVYVSNDPLNEVDPDGLLSLLGVLRFTGGVAEAGVGVGFGFATSWTGAGAVAGGAIVVHGLDVAQAAWRGTDTFASQGLQAAGVSRTAANAVDTAISGAAFIAAGSPLLPYGAAAVSGGGAGTSLLSTVARTSLPRTVVDQNAGPVWNALRSYYGTGTTGSIIGRAASDVSVGAGSSMVGVSAAQEFIGTAK